MNIDPRQNKLYDIHNHIESECERMNENLNLVLRKSEVVISLLRKLNHTDVLKKFRPTFEYLNKLHMQVLQQNCTLELFLLELDAQNPVVTQKSLPSLPSDVTSNLEMTSNLFTTDNSKYVTSQSNANNTCYDNTALMSNEGNKNIVTPQHFELHAQTVVASNTLSDKTLDINSRTSNDSQQKTENNDEPVNDKNKKNVRNKQYTDDSSSTDLSDPDDLLKIYSPPKTAFKQKPCKDVPSLFDNVEEVSLVGTSENKKETRTNKEMNVHMINANEIKERLDKHMKEKAHICDVILPDLKLRPESKTNPVQTSNLPQYANVEHNGVPLEKINNPNSPKINNSNKLTYQVTPKKLDENQIVIRHAPLPKDGELCFISFVESPSHFYVQILREENTLIDLLSEQIEEVAHKLKSFPTKLDAFKAINKYCLCYCEDAGASGWHRSEIIGWMMEDENRVHVRFLDYGITSKVPLKNIREAINYFFVLPIMAVKCQLAWIKPPPTNSHASDVWPKESIDYFNELMDPEANRLFTICFSEQNGDAVDVDFRTGDSERSVVGLMIDAELAVENILDEQTRLQADFMNQQALKSQGLYEDDCNANDIERGFEMDDEEEENPMTAVAHYNPRDEAQICRIFLSRGSCFKGSNCRFSHKPLNPDGWTTDTEPVYYDAFNQIELPCPGTEITLKVINIIDLCTFYVVIKRSPDCHISASQTVNTMKYLVNYMNLPKEVKTFKKCKGIPTLSQMVLVKYNDLWQRARVVNSVEYANRVELDVYLVDFGMNMSVNMNDTRDMKGEFMHLPFQAIKCTLANVLVKDDITEEETDTGFDYLEIHTIDKRLRAKIMFNMGYLSVRLYDEDGFDIAEEMTKAGLLVECNSYTPKPECGQLVD